MLGIPPSSASDLPVPVIPTKSLLRSFGPTTYHGLLRDSASARLSEFLNLLLHVSGIVLLHVSQTFSPVRFRLVHDLLSEKWPL